MNEREWPVPAMAVGLAVALVVLGLVILVERYVAGWNGTYLALFAGLVAFEAFASYQVRRRDPYHQHTGWRATAAELLILFIALEIVADLAAGAPVLRGLTPNFQSGAVWEALPLFGIWLLALDLARDFDRLGEGPAHDPRYLSPEHALTVRFLAGAVILFFLVGLQRPGLLPAGSGAAAGPPWPVLLLYLLTGIFLLGYAHFSTLRRRWRDRDFTVLPGLTGRWWRLTGAFVALVLILAFLVPSGYALGITGIFGVIGRELGDLLSQLARLFGSGQHTVPPGFKPPPPHPRAHPTFPVPKHGPGHPHRGGPDLSGILRSILFWAAIAATAFYLARLTLAGRLAGSMRGLVPGRLRRLLAALWNRLRRTAGAVALGPLRPRGTLADEVVETAGIRRLVPFLRPSTLTPRQRIFYDYAAFLRRGRRQGVPRAAGETPWEYDAALKPEIGPAAGDLDALTSTFVEARYSRHPIEEVHAVTAHSAWQKVRTALRRLS